MDEDRITLDRSTFRALASDSRVALLKALGERRKTPSELARESGLTVQSVSEHLEHLKKAGLAARVETGRKWVYYELTPKGRGVLQPESSKARVWIVLALCLLAVGSFLFISLQNSSLQPMAAPAVGNMERTPSSSLPAGGAPVLSIATGIVSPSPAPANATNSTQVP